MARARRQKNPGYKDSGKFAIEVTGIKELDEKFLAMPNTLQKKALRPACRIVAKITLQDARTRAPVKTGDLRKSLTVRATKINRSNAKYIVGASVTTRDGLFRGDQFYGGFLEMGTDQRKTKRGDNRGRVEKERWNFLRPALLAFPELKLWEFRKAVGMWMAFQADKQIAAREAKQAQRAKKT